MIDGPVETIGNATGIDKDLLATNQQLVAMDHIIPDIIPGSIAFGYIFGLFVANRSLSIPVAFPIVSTGPSIIASLWGTVVFREIKVSILDNNCLIV
jgi:hypothetical protein